MIYKKITDLIGNTPIVQLDSEFWGLKNTDIYVKLEYLNPFGSIKDRTGLALVKDQDLSAKDIIESSSGNTAKSLQILASMHGKKLVSVTNRIKVPEVEKVLRYLGAEIIALPGQSECPDPNDEGNANNVIEKMKAENPDLYYHTNQYENRANTEVHMKTTAKEAFSDLGQIDAVVMGVGTAGSSGGFVEYAKNNHQDTKMIGVLSDPADFLPGIRSQNELFETNLFESEYYDQLVSVTSEDALFNLRQMVMYDGILAGPTTGANLAAALKFAKNHDELIDGQRQKILIIACDRLETYMSYIEKRQPEIFHAKSNADLFKQIDIDSSCIEKEASEETANWIEKEQILVVDTRGVKPYSMFHIKNSINYPEEILREILVDGTPFVNRKIMFVCPIGDRSLQLAKILSSRGLEAYSLRGGLTAWRAAGLNLERKR